MVCLGVTVGLYGNQQLFARRTERKNSLSCFREGNRGSVLNAHSGFCYRVGLENLFLFLTLCDILVPNAPVLHIRSTLCLPPFWALPPRYVRVCESCACPEFSSGVFAKNISLAFSCRIASVAASAIVKACSMLCGFAIRTCRPTVPFKPATKLDTSVPFFRDVFVALPGRPCP